MPKKSRYKKKKVAPGIYNAMIEKVSDKGNGNIEVQLKLYGKGFEFTERHTLKAEESTPEQGMFKYFICCSKLGIYTGIGADNRHHAANKATKLFGPHWSSLTQDAYLIRGYVFENVSSFNKLVRVLQN